MTEFSEFIICYFYTRMWIIFLKPFKPCIKTVYANTYKIKPIESTY